MPLPQDRRGDVSRRIVVCAREARERSELLLRFTLRLLRFGDRPEIEKHLLGNPVFRGEPASGAKTLRLRLLPWPGGICGDGVLITSEVMKRAVLIPKDFERARRLADVVVVRLNTSARLA